MSTLSPSRSGATALDSQSSSLSIEPTASILAPKSGDSPALPSRNKLVKRSASRRALQNPNASLARLRRPATGHQITSTVSQHDSNEVQTSNTTPTRVSKLDNPSQDSQIPDESLRVWLPFFTNNASSLAEAGSPNKRRGITRVSRRGSRSVFPSTSGSPTLLLATSIVSRSSHELQDERISQPSDFGRPSTATGFETLDYPGSRASEPSSLSRGLKSRYSFSINNILPSPSPSSRRTPRPTGFGKGNSARVLPVERRTVSAPYPANVRHVASPSAKNVGTTRSMDDSLPAEGNTAPLESASKLYRTQERSASSPLPPLNRMSAFELDVPAYLPRPRSGTATPDHNLKFSASPSPISSSVGPNQHRKRTHRSSVAPSDHASTLLGSDNDYSRLLSSDEDDMDYRSDTMYDSTRTGATGSSHSGMRRLPIETIFDEPLPEKPAISKLLALQDLLKEGSVVHASANMQQVSEEGRISTTPINGSHPSNQNDPPTTVHIPSGPPPMTFPSSSLIIPSKAQVDNTNKRSIDALPDEEDWAIDDDDDPENTKEKLLYNGDSAGSLILPLDQEPDRYIDRIDQPKADEPLKSNIFEWSEQPHPGKDLPRDSSPRPRTVHGMKSKEVRSSRTVGRRGSSGIHFRSQSVPVPPETSSHRSHHTNSKLESWVLGNKGVSEDWDGDFDFEDSPRLSQPANPINEGLRSSSSSGMLVPRAILERQASVHGQFGQVKELTLLVEELKRLRQQASNQGIMHGQSAELWKEAEGIINLATLDDDEQEFLPPRSPHMIGADFDIFDEDSPSGASRRKSGYLPPKDDTSSALDEASASQTLSHASSGKSLPTTPPHSRPRKESTAQAKSVLENIHQQRLQYELAFKEAKSSQKKLPFDTTSLRDLVTRAGVVTRALKEIVRRADNTPSTPPSQLSTLSDPLFSQIFHPPPSPPSISKTPRLAQSPKNNNFRGGNIAGNDNDINGHMKMMTVV